MSELKVDKVSPRSGTALEIGDSGDIITLPAGSVTEKGADIASATTLVIGTDGDYFDITGTTAITDMTVTAGRRFTLQFNGAVVLTYHATNLYLPGAVNLTTEANDSLTFIATAANQVRCIGYALKDGGSPVTASASAGTIGTEADTTSGTTHDFTGIPSGTNLIILAFEDCGGSGLDNIIIQLGDSGGFETSGYSTSCTVCPNGGATISLEFGGGIGFALGMGNQSYACRTLVFLQLHDATNFSWTFSFAGRQISTRGFFGGGNKSLSAELTQVRVTTDGSNTFDQGSLNLTYY